MRLSRTQKLFYAGLLLGVLAAGAAANVVVLPPGDSAHVSGGVPLTHPDGATVVVHGDTNMSLNDPFTNASEPGPEGVNITSDAGNITVYSAGSTHSRLYTTNMTGPWTNATSITAGGTWITFYPEAKQQFSVRGDVTAFSLHESVALDDGTADFYYAGTDGGTVSVRLTDVPPDTQIAAVNASTDAILDAATATSSGTITFDLDASSHTVELVDASDTTPPSHSNASPTGETTSAPSTLAVNVADSDYPTDEVHTEIHFEGAQVHSATLTSNGTVSTTNFTANTLGETYTWSVHSQDAYGAWTNTTYQFSLPGNLTFRNETQASQIIAGQDATATFYTVGGSQVIQKTDSDGDGKISLAGLPNTEFVVTVESENYYDRRIYIETLFQQQNIYLLNSTAYPDATFTEFTLDDRTGEFPPDTTTLRVQRALDPNDDSDSQWVTVAGDFFGATNRFPFTGETQARYRLVVENAQGDRRVLGSYIPTVGGVQSIPIGQVSFSAENIDDGTIFQASLAKKEQGRFLTLRYLDLENATESVTYRVVDASNESRVVISNTTWSDVEGETVAVRNMTLLDPQLNEETGYRVEYWVARTERSDQSGHVFAGAVRQLTQLGIPPWILELGLWVALVAWAGMSALASRKLSLLSTPVVAAAFSITGLMSIPSVLVAIAFVIGGLLYFGESSNVP